ncbi:unnamed protein product [Paramecium primaurelia]|uniref:Transmembrane protein n=1 Tax=Paramecium primaurelia TaxID=5886 RepID=A0A8S1JT67_PARPR|nr:unnamed protein product [Paramecium primaurelia]
MKQKPSYWKSTHFAASVQYLNFLIECIIFPLALILYINHYKMDRNLYDNWEFKPIIEIQKVYGSKCPSDLETFFAYNYPETSSGCDCGFGEEDENVEIDYDKLKNEHCQESEIDEGCDEIASIQSQDFVIWKGYSICGKRSQYTYRELFYERNCTAICNGVCQTKNNQNDCGNYEDLISKENITQSYYNFTLSYGIDVCYENGESINQYPLLESAYKCVIQSSEYAYIDEFDQYLLFEENEYPYDSLPGLEYFDEIPKFGLFGQKFTEYNCTIKQIDVSNYRDNYIQLVFLIALIMAGCLMGFGAIFHSAIVQNLTRKGIFKHKIYKVTWKFYCPTTFLILLHMAHLAIVGTKLGFLAHFRTTMHNYIENKCTDWSNILNLVYMRDIIDAELMPLCIPELVLTFVAMLLEILQLCLFDRRIPETIASPTLKGRESPSKSNNFILNFGFDKDENIEKHVLDTENIRINKKNEQLKLYNE